MAPWTLLIAALRGEVNEALVARIEYLEEELRIHRQANEGKRIRFTDAERIALAEKAMALPREMMLATVSIVTPKTILRWHRELIRRKWDHSDKSTGTVGRPRKVEEAKLIEQFARENSRWGYKRLMAAIMELDYDISRSGVAVILKRLGIHPEPGPGTSWKAFLNQHANIWATDFFCEEVWTKTGLRTIYVLFFIHLESRKVVIGGFHQYPNEQWMIQVARNLTWEGGALEDASHLIHDCDAKYSKAFDDVMEGSGCEVIKLPARSPNLNAFAERFVRSIRDDCLDHLILFGESQLRFVVREFVEHYHTERPHQGKGNKVLFPDERSKGTGEITRKRRIGGLLNYYHREAA